MDKEKLSEKELEERLNNFDKLIEDSISEIDDSLYRMIEKCSFADVCGSVLKKVGSDDFRRIWDSCRTHELNHRITENYKGPHIYKFDWDKMAHAIFDLVIKYYGHRNALIAIFHGADDVVKGQRTSEQVFGWLVEQENLLDEIITIKGTDTCTKSTEK